MTIEWVHPEAEKRGEHVRSLFDENDSREHILEMLLLAIVMLGDAAGDRLPPSIVSQVPKSELDDGVVSYLLQTVKRGD